MASFTARRASVHLYFSGLPIDLQVVVLEPGITEDHVLLPEAGDSEERSFGVGFVVEDYVYNFGDPACFIGVTNFIQPYLHQFSIDSHGLNGYGKPLKRPFDRYQSRLKAISNGRDIRQINW